MATGEDSALTNSARINLRRVLWLRTISLGGLGLCLWFAVARLGLALPLRPLLGTLAAMAAFSLATLWRLRFTWPVQDRELFVQLLLDVAALTALFYFTGGTTNPFVMLYLLPLATAAAALPAAYVWAMAAIAAGCYTLLFGWHLPLPATGHLHESSFGVHVFGMWLGFMLSAALIASFAVRMNTTLRDRDRMLAELREQGLRQERIVAIGTLAAGAAHELGTPLSTMAVLVKDIQPGEAVAAGKLEILRAQIVRCKEILASLSAAAGQVRAVSGQSRPLDAFLEELVRRWQATRPGVRAHTRLAGPGPAPRIVAEQTLAQAITNILNNAADVSPQDVELEGRWTPDELVLEIADRGPGLEPELAHKAGEPFHTTKSEGLGLGLFLAYTTLNRLGGDVRLMNREGGGVLCRLTLPLTALRVQH
jgi:two-component system sensor histidine kinase RegB